MNCSLTGARLRPPLSSILVFFPFSLQPSRSSVFSFKNLFSICLQLLLQFFRGRDAVHMMALYTTKYTDMNKDVVDVVLLIHISIYLYSQRAEEIHLYIR